MTTAAAIDRIVHHAVILELTGPSYRAEAAKAKLEKDRTTVSSEGIIGANPNAAGV
jgi:hypothetical protein